MPSILDAKKLQALTQWVKTPEDIEKAVAKFDASSKDAPLFFQQLEIAGKGDILEEYVATYAPEED
jgi:hypothetical protein